jgi:alpha-mannosidase
MHLGRTWLLNEFGISPNIGWQLDAFGHTETHTELLSQMGIDTLVLARISEDERERKK